MAAGSREHGGKARMADTGLATSRSARPAPREHDLPRGLVRLPPVVLDPSHERAASGSVPTVLLPVALPTRRRTARTRPAWSDRLAGLALSGLLLYLLALPLIDQIVGVRVTWGVHLAFAGVGLARLARARVRHAGIVGLTALPWAVGALAWPAASEWAAGTRLIANEGAGLLACGLLTLGAVAVGAGTWRGVRLHVRAWLTLGAVCIPIGLWEIGTQQHLGPGPWLPPPWSAAVTFVNPNNLASVLLVVYGLSLLLLLGPLTPARRLVAVALAIGSVIVMVATLSRLAVAAAIALTVVACILAAHRRGLVRRPATAREWRAAGAVFVALPMVGVATLTVPALAQHNPLARFLIPGDASTARADDLRLSLARAGLEMWQTDPWRGVGAARFETLLRAQGAERVMPMHNGFLEILTEHGLLVAIPFALWLVALAWHMLRGRPAPTTTPASRPAGRRPELDPSASRFAILVWLTGFVVAGSVTSSPVTWPFWYLMAASATASAWAGVSSRRSEQ